MERAEKFSKEVSKEGFSITSLCRVSSISQTYVRML